MSLKRIATDCTFAMHCRRLANDYRINCKAASHGDEDRGTPVAPYCRMAVRAACRRGAWIALAGPLGPRANKRRFDSFLQELASRPLGPNRLKVFVHSMQCYLGMALTLK